MLELFVRFFVDLFFLGAVNGEPHGGHVGGIRAIGALVSTIMLYPLDTCKTKLQAELQTHQGMHKYRVTMSLSRDEQKLNDSLKVDFDTYASQIRKPHV
ncbi:hypothetical protein PVAP13_3NG181027 [Panicum virgatum]|uniref:Uncharacterized protein n=1 Tax=Panicum virgatum TaxID=38727 RepID=A0A8T0U8U1_PANVG|nr:hypothetical protein PVAP13_3NG181027 [Panicum virgatum]